MPTISNVVDMQAHCAGACEGRHFCACRLAHIAARFGTLMKANGEDFETIQELLRYATFKVTADTYTQAVTTVKRDAQARIAKLILADSIAEKPVTPVVQ